MLFVICIWFFYCNTFAQSTENAIKFSSLHEALNASENELTKLIADHNLPSLVCGISVKGKVLFQKAYGYIDLENSVSATLESKYRIGSISKSVTSALIGSLVDRGVVHFDDNLSQYLSESIYPQKTWHNKPVNITIGQLLSHTGGVHVMDEQLDFDPVVVATNCTQMIHKLKNKPLSYQPGTKMAYSNYGYQLLGAIIESITGKTFQQAIKEFFGQHRLDSSYAETQDLMIQNRAYYYKALNKNSTKVNIRTDVSDEILIAEGYWPAGGLISTVGDLIKFGQLMIDSYKGKNASILTHATIQQMWTPKVNAVPNILFYGYGWAITKFDAIDAKSKIKTAIWHDGGLAGLTTILGTFPKEDIAVVAMTNKGNMDGLNEIMNRMALNVYDFVV